MRPTGEDACCSFRKATSGPLSGATQTMRSIFTSSLAGLPYSSRKSMLTPISRRASKPILNLKPVPLASAKRLATWRLVTTRPSSITQAVPA
jgi:hypothetical protein